MIPEELFKRRRHHFTPESILLIMVNYIVLAVAIESMAVCAKIHWFFWVTLLLLATYNFFNIRKNREEYNRVRTIAYIISVAGMALMFFLFRMQPQNC